MVAFVDGSFEIVDTWDMTTCCVVLPQHPTAPSMDEMSEMGEMSEMSEMSEAMGGMGGMSGMGGMHRGSTPEISWSAAIVPCAGVENVLRRRSGGEENSRVVHVVSSNDVGVVSLWRVDGEGHRERVARSGIRGEDGLGRALDLVCFDGGSCVAVLHESGCRLLRLSRGGSARQEEEGKGNSERENKKEKEKEGGGGIEEISFC